MEWINAIEKEQYQPKNCTWVKAISTWSRSSHHSIIIITLTIALPRSHRTNNISQHERKRCEGMPNWDKHCRRIKGTTTDNNHLYITHIFIQIPWHTFPCLLTRVHSLNLLQVQTYIQSKKCVAYISGEDVLHSVWFEAHLNAYLVVLPILLFDIIIIVTTCTGYFLSQTGMPFAI